jgi:hypothetical protein
MKNNLQELSQKGKIKIKIENYEFEPALWKSLSLKLS